MTSLVPNYKEEKKKIQYKVKMKRGFEKCLHYENYYSFHYYERT